MKRYFSQIISVVFSVRSLSFGIIFLFFFLSQLSTLPLYAAPVCSFPAHASGEGPYSLEGFKFWDGLPSTFYQVSISVSNAPGDYKVYLVKPSGQSILFLANQSSANIKKYFEANSDLYSGGGYKFRVTADGDANDIWVESESFYQGVLPKLTRPSLDIRITKI